MQINGIEAVELLGTADPAAAAAVRNRGRKPVVERTAAQPLTINGIEGVILGTAASGPGSVYRLDSADPLLALAARQRGQRAVLVVDSTGAVVPSTPEAWYEEGTTYDALAAVMDFNNDRYAMPTFGSELVTNGGFADATGWTLTGAGASIGSGVLTKTAGSAATANFAIAPSAGALYAVTYTVTAYVAGTVRPQFTTGSTVSGTTRSAAGTYTDYLTAATGNNTLRLDLNAASDLTVDNVSVKEVVLTATGRTYGSELVVNGDFATAETLGSELVTNGDFVDGSGWGGTGWSFAAGVATRATAANALAQSSPPTIAIGALYKVVFTITAVTAAGGGISVTLGGVTGAIRSATGTYTEYFLATATTALTVVGRGANTFEGSIDNISIKVVTNQSSVGWLLKSTPVGTETMTISGGTLNLTGDGTNAAYADQSFTTVASQVYEFTFTLGTANAAVKVGTTQGSSNLATTTPSAVGTYTIKFVATGTTSWIRFEKVSAVTITVDNVSIRALTAIGTYPKREATFDECFAYTAASTTARTYTDNLGVLKNMGEVGFAGEMLTNTAFATDITGWTSNSTGTGVFEWSSDYSGSLRLRRVDSSNIGQGYATLTTVSGTLYQVSFEVKQMGASQSVAVVGSTGTTAGSLAVFSGSNNLGNGVTGVATFTFLATGTTTYLRIVPQNNIGEEIRLDNFSVMPSSGVNARRMTYANAKRQLRLENAGTNLALQSQTFGTTWAVSDTTISSDVVVAPDGTTTADNLVENTATAAHILTQSISFTSGTSYAYSVYAKAGTASRLQLSFGTGAFSGAGYANFGLTGSGSVLASGGTLVSSSITLVGNGWYRCTIVATATATTAASAIVYMINADAAARAVSYTGTSLTVSLWGAQVEASAFATDYIPTTTAAVTRAIETARLSPLLEAVLQRAQGSVLVRGQNAPTDFSALVGGDTTVAFIRRQTSTTARAFDATTSLTAILGSGSFDGAFGAAMGYDVSGRALSANSSTAATDTVVSPGARTTAYLGRNPSSNYGTGYYDLLGISPERLPSTDLQALAVAAA